MSNAGVYFEATTVHYGTIIMPGYQIGVAQSLGGSAIDTSTWFTVVGEPAADTGFYGIRAVDHNLDEGSDWYVTSPNAAFTPGSISALRFQPLIVGNTFFLPQYIPNGDFFLAYNTGLSPGPIRGEAFGWLRLRNTDGTLTLLSSAVAYDEPGIVIGTTTVIPEPATFATLLASGAMMLRRRTVR